MILQARRQKQYVPLRLHGGITRKATVYKGYMLHFGTWDQITWKRYIQETGLNNLKMLHSGNRARTFWKCYIQETGLRHSKNVTFNKQGSDNSKMLHSPNRDHIIWSCSYQITGITQWDKSNKQYREVLKLLDYWVKITFLSPLPPKKRNYITSRCEKTNEKCDIVRVAMFQLTAHKKTRHIVKSWASVFLLGVTVHFLTVFLQHLIKSK
jgi:hypothetical protein